MLSYRTREAVERLVETYGDMLVRLAYARLGCTADAEDAVQDAFLYLLEHDVTFKSAQHEKAWLIRTVLHRAADRLKRADRRAVPLEEAGGLGVSPPQETSLPEAVRSLPEKYGVPLFLHYYAGYSIREIGTLLRLPASTVGTRLARGREMLRNILKEEN